MEDILDLYESECNFEKPVVCVDEKPYQLLNNKIEPIPLKKGHSKKIDYEYKREGTCNIFIISEPFNGLREVKVTQRRTKEDFAELLKDLSDKYYPHAKTIRLVMDNLNIHNLSILYEFYTPEEARRLIKRFEVHYTPVHGSWLNIAEIELSVMAKQCIKRRIPNVEILKNEIDSWKNERNNEKIGVNWRFTAKDARIKLKRLYPS
jgi:DDE superfamily endonuclease